MQRTKGAAWERDVVRRMNEPGLELEAQRNLSQARDGGHDIDSIAGLGECKARAAIADYLVPREGIRWVAFKADRREPLLILRLDDGLQLLAREAAALRAAPDLETNAIRTTIRITKPRPGSALTEG